MKFHSVTSLQNKCFEVKEICITKDSQQKQIPMRRNIPLLIYVNSVGKHMSYISFFHLFAACQCPRDRSTTCKGRVHIDI